MAFDLGKASDLSWACDLWMASAPSMASDLSWAYDLLMAFDLPHASGPSMASDLAWDLLLHSCNASMSLGLSEDELLVPEIYGVIFYSQYTLADYILILRSMYAPQ